MTAFSAKKKASSEGASGRRWILDPIDGTFAFVHGVPFYGVLIALEIEGEMSVGVVNMPALGEIVSAAKGCGCFLNGEPARVSTTAELKDALLLSTDFRSARDTVSDARLSCCKRERRRAARGAIVMVTFWSRPAART